jgi:ParB family chromosome partitioning protein
MNNRNDEPKFKKIFEIPISEIDAFPKHPFKVKNDEDMSNITNSIRQNGVLTPATVRLKEDGRYEMLSGHRRKRACELLELDTLRCEVVELSRDEATIFMCDSNLQRTTILPSEKAWSYKMRFDAMKRKSGRHPNASDQPGDFLENGAPLGPHSLKGRSRDLLAKEVGEGREQVRRYIRLTYLIPSLLAIIDKGRIGIRPAVELSYLSKDFQEYVRNEINYTESTPTHAQARRIRALYEKGALNKDVIVDIMREEKPNQKEKIVLRGERFKKLLPVDLPIYKREDYVAAAIEHYNRYLERKNRGQER